MKLIVNGQEKTVAGPLVISELLEQYQINPGSVVVERNKSVVRKQTYSEIKLEEGDQIEIVQFVGGGS